MNQKLSTTAALLLAAPTFAGGGDPAEGFRLYSPTGDTNTYLIDTDGEFVHTWTSNLGPTAGIHLEDDGTLTRAVNPQTGPPIGGAGGAIQRQKFDGEIVWDFNYDGPDAIAHHDIAPLPNGNVLMIAWEVSTVADAIAAGRDPALVSGTDWFPDEVVELEQTGLNTANIVWKWRMMDHIVQDFDNTKPNFGNPADHPEKLDINFPDNVVANGDWNHCNSIDYDPVNDLIVLSSPFQNEFWIIDHSTTTSEAAGSTGGNYGKGGDFLYRWGNPRAYDAGTTADQQLWFHHSTNFIDEGLPGAGNILIFNNRAGTPLGIDASSIVELELPATFDLLPGESYGPETFLWEYQPAVPTDLYSAIVSSARRLPNGNTLVCAGNQNGWIFEVTNAGDVVWEHFNQFPAPTAIVFQSTYWERYLWADRGDISTSAGGSVEFNLVAGSKRAGDLYVLLGSFTGTSPGFVLDGVTVPLNFDAYTTITLTDANGPLLPGSVGNLDTLGNGTAGLNLPAGLATGLTGATVHHAFVVVNPTTLFVEFASNPVPLDLLP